MMDTLKLESLRDAHARELWECSYQNCTDVQRQIIDQNLPIQKMLADEGMSDREWRIRAQCSGGKFPISAVDALYLLGVIDVIREDRKRIRDQFQTDQA